MNSHKSIKSNEIYKVKHWLSTIYDTSEAGGYKKIYTHNYIIKLLFDKLKHTLNRHDIKILDEEILFDEFVYFIYDNSSKKKYKFIKLD